MKIKKAKKINYIIKKGLQALYNRYGYSVTLEIIGNMTSPNQEQKYQMIEYIEELENQTISVYDDLEMMYKDIAVEKPNNIRKVNK